MSNYSKPIISIDDGMAEGVYTASGSNGCYTYNAYIHQTPQTGRGDYRIQVNAHHNATHTNTKQTLTISFNQTVTYVSCNAQNASVIGSKTGSTLTISLGYTQNQTDNIGFGDLVVTSDPGLVITAVSVTDDAV